MHAVFNRGELLVLLKAFYTLTGLRAVIFDASGTDILSYPTELPAFCRLIRETPSGKSGCMQCDQKACRMARRERNTLIYPCHAGLMEMITPIQVENSTVGYLLLSHIVQGADEEAGWALVQEYCKDYEIDPERLYEAYQALPRSPENILKAASDLLSLAAGALYQERLACLVPDSPQEQLSRFLTDHLGEDLSCERLCTLFGISRTTLYHMAREAYGCGISEHISHLRIQRALHLLAETDRTPNEISQEIGIADYNYFFRLFKRQTGMTPGAYRRQFSEKTAEKKNSP